jgi:hypothetical protein
MGAQTGYVYVVSLGSSAKITTPSQHRVLGVLAEHGVSLAVEIKRSELFVMRWGVVLYKVVTQVFVSGGPSDVELSLFNGVLDPVIAHVHSPGTFVENGFVCNAISGGIVGFELCSIPTSFSVYWVTVPVLPLTNRAPYSASATEEATCLRTVGWQSRVP